MPVATDSAMRRQHLVRDAEQRPQDVDAAIRIDDADVEEVSPARDDERAGEQRPRDTRTCGRAAPRPGPAASCSMKRPTRVPASTVVRMNTASNMMAKWYQTLISPVPKLVPKMLAMPTASEGAPPVRAKRVLSPISRRQRLHLLDRDREAPAGDRRHRRFAAAAPTTPAPVLMAKYTPGSSSVAAIIAMMPTKDSSAMLP